MSLIPTVYRSTDPGAPSLSGTIGSLVGVLDAVLVNGYGSGAEAKAGAGWTIAFTDTHKRVYRNNPITGTGTYLRIDDTAAVSPGNARHAWMRSFEAMTNIDDGTGPAPLTSDLLNGAIFPKSNSLTSDARAWVAIATERFVYFFVDLGVAGVWAGIPFFPVFAGDIVSRKPGDLFNFCIAAISRTTWAGGGTETNTVLIAGGPWTFTSTSKAGWIQRRHTHEPGAVRFEITGLADHQTGACLGSLSEFPDPVSAGMFFEKLMVCEGGRAIRGYMPNVYAPLGFLPFADSDVRVDELQGLPSGTKIYPKWYGISPAGSGLGGTSYSGSLLFDISNTW